MASKVTRMLLVGVTALALAMGALGLSGAAGSDWAEVEVSAANGGTATGGDG